MIETLLVWCAFFEFCVIKLQATALWDLPYSFYSEFGYFWFDVCSVGVAPGRMGPYDLMVAEIRP